MLRFFAGSSAVVEDRMVKVNPSGRGGKGTRERKGGRGGRERERAEGKEGSEREERRTWLGRRVRRVVKGKGVSPSNLQARTKLFHERGGMGGKKVWEGEERRRERLRATKRRERARARRRGIERRGPREPSLLLERLSIDRKTDQHERISTKLESETASPAKVYLSLTKIGS